MDVARDYEAIRGLIHRYAELIDLGDLDGVAALFADATWTATGRTQPLRGAEQARRAYDGVILYDGIPRTKHVISNVTIELADDAASADARSYFTVLQAHPDLPLQVIIAGRYHDTFAKRDGGWQFASREILPDLLGDLSRHLAPGSGL
jgi:3-phenylpropionate/cinnamic acid dioxygenase small subunit